MTDNTLPAGLRAVSEQLVRARATGRALAGPPEGLPASLDEAYRLQEHSIGHWSDRVVGWKVGGVPSGYSDRFAEKFLAGPIFAQTVRQANGGGHVAMPVFVGGFAAIEPEFIVLIGDEPAQDRLFIGAEIASSPIPAINDYGPMAIISDFGNNNGLLVGPEIEQWRERVKPVRVATSIDGMLIGEKEVEDFPAAAMEALAFMRKLAVERGYHLAPGTYVSTGAITGVHEAPVGAQARLDFGDLGAVELELVGIESR